MDATDFHGYAENQHRCTFPNCTWHATADPWLGNEIATAAHAAHFAEVHAADVEVYELIAGSLALVPA